MSDSPFDGELSVINVGLERFQETLKRTGTPVVNVDWSPPEGVNEVLGQRLTALSSHGDKINEANQEAFDRLTSATPLWTDVGTARNEIPWLSDRKLLHAGPPVTWTEMSGPQRGAVIGAMIYEGWAESPEEAVDVAEAGEISFAPCHDHRTVAPMAGVVSPSMPVAIIENEVHGNVAYTNLNEGRGSTLRFGAYSEDVIDRLEWMESELAPVLKSVINTVGGINLKSMIARALQMGDELHNRNVAGTSLLIRRLLPGLFDTDLPASTRQSVAEFVTDTDIFALNLAMAGSKVAADAAAGIPWSSMVTAMTRNGTEFGIRVSGLDDAWFTAPAPEVDGLYFPEYSAADASRDIGDSTIAETTGLGGFAMASAPAITDFVGGTPQDAVEHTLEMYEITIGENPNYTIPGLDFRGTPTGIDILSVLDTGIRPFINTGIAHKEPGVGQVGAGLVRAPQECFLGAATALCEQYP
jgi:hypothetical protein